MARGPCMNCGETWERHQMGMWCRPWAPLPAQATHHQRAARRWRWACAAALALYVAVPLVAAGALLWLEVSRGR